VGSLFEFVAYGKAPLGEIPLRRGRTLFCFFPLPVVAEGDGGTGWGIGGRMFNMMNVNQRVKH
jgi:hypothetical protein